MTYELVSGNRELFAIGARDGAVRYVGPGEDFESEPNRYELRVHARDSHGGEVGARVIVTVIDVNEPPAARDDEATTPEDQAVTVDVLANDTDPGGNGLRIGSVSSPRHGTTAIAAGGVLYTPEPDYHGADSFTYVASDPAGWTATATVRVTVLPVNDAPVAVGTIPDQFLDEGGYEETVELTPFFDDIDGDALTFRARSSNTDVVTVTVAGAVLTLTPVVYGSASVTVTAADPGGLTATQTFAVGVDDRLIREVLWNTLAAMARSHLASARMALGRRAAADAREGPRLTLLGRPVPLGRSQAGQTGTGVEFLGGVRAAGGRVRIDAQGRMLALHSATGYRERGAAVTLSVGSRNQEGLSLSVSPRWGDAAAGGGALWEDQVYRRYRPDAAGHAWALDARAEYGTRLRGGRLLKWFGSLSQSHYGPRLLVGGRVAQAGR